MMFLSRRVTAAAFLLSAACSAAACGSRGTLEIRALLEDVPLPRTSLTDILKRSEQVLGVAESYRLNRETPMPVMVEEPMFAMASAMPISRGSGALARAFAV